MEGGKYNQQISSRGSTNGSVEMGTLSDLDDPNEIHFVWVGRVRDRKVLIHAITNRQLQYHQHKFIETAKTYLQAASHQSQIEYQPPPTIKMGHDAFKHHTFTDKNFIVFSAITSLAYPADLAQRFLQHLQEDLYNADPIEFKRDPQKIMELDQALKFNIYEMHSKYKNAASAKDNKALAAQSKLNAVTSLMKSNLGSMISNNSQLSDIESQSSDLAGTARRFRHGAKKLKRNSRWQNIRQWLMILAFFLTLGLVLYIMSPSQNHAELAQAATGNL